MQECQLGGKAVGGLEKGQGFMNRLILMVMVMMMVMVMVVVMMAVVTMTTGECDYGLGDDGDPRGQGERPDKANTKEEIWIVFIIIIMIIKNHYYIIMIIIIITIVFLI